MSRGLEWSGVGCGSHIPPETQITLQETPALQDTHCLPVIYKHTALWDTHTHTHTFKSQRLALSRCYTSIPRSLSSFPLLPSCLSGHSQTLGSQRRARRLSFCCRSQLRHRRVAVIPQRCPFIDFVSILSCNNNERIFQK